MTTTKTQTLAQALHLATTGKSAALARAASCLHGCPVSGWGETSQARRRLADDLPRPEDRDYTIDEFIEAAYYVSSGHYYRRARLTAPMKRTPIHAGDEIAVTYPSGAISYGVVTGHDRDSAERMVSFRCAGEAEDRQAPERWCSLAAVTPPEEPTP